uniref:Uncharacterized protein n=1 Tax=Arundo donax TaxID=35708 RepID=A0A0A9BI61_ARUDO
MLKGYFLKVNCMREICSANFIMIIVYL